MLAFTARRLLTPDGIIEHAVMVVDDGRVLEIVPRAEGRLATGASHVDFGDAVIAPGYVDLHIHGSADLTSWTTAPKPYLRLSAFWRGTRHELFSDYCDCSNGEHVAGAGTAGGCD